jgi:glycosyltransferase involved in cell wall biosynthesis
VGRWTPHKRLEDLVDALAAYRRMAGGRLLGGDCALVLAGSGGDGQYPELVRDRIRACGLDPHVHWIDQPSDGQLATAYARCTAYVSASRHEGFGIPPVEAMGFGKPVLAYAAPATRDTLGGAAVLWDDLDPEKIAAVWHATLSDPSAVEAVLAAQDARYSELLRAADGATLAEAFAEALSRAARPC